MNAPANEHIIEHASERYAVHPTELHEWGHSYQQ
jgi:hypothetical protein